MFSGESPAAGAAILRAGTAAQRVLLPARLGALLGLWNGVDRVLRPGRVVAIGRGHVLKPALEANDGDCRVAQAGEVARRVAHMRPAAVLVVCPVANVVNAVLNVPVLADDAEQHAGIGPVPVGRGQAVSGVFGYFPGFDAFDRSADPDGLLSSVEIAAAVPFGGRQVDRVAAVPFDAAVLPVVRLACPVDVLQVLTDTKKCGDLIIWTPFRLAWKKMRVACFRFPSGAFGA